MVMEPIVPEQLPVTERRVHKRVMAPDATIIALKVLDATGNGTESGVWAAIQFIVDHGGDVISMSLGWQHSWGVDRESWRNSFNNALAAGVIASVAAGNEGGDLGLIPSLIM